MAALDAGRHNRMFHVFYDGDCGMCDRATYFFVTRYHRNDVRFAPLGGETARRLLGDFPALNSVVVRRRDGRVLQESDAVLYLLHQLGGGWRALARLGACVPAVLRNLVYKFIARTRKWIVRGRPEKCALLPKEKRALILP